MRRGPRAGLEMWGCSRYPDCTGAINIDPEPPVADPADPTAKPVAGDPGSYLQARFEREQRRARLLRRAALPLFVALTVLAITTIFFALQPFGVIWAAIGAVAAGAASMFTMLRLPFESLIWAKGIEGEQKAGDILSGLEAEGFITLYNRRAPTAKGDIDAITIGPTGVFIVETKNWGGKVEVHRDLLWVGDHDRTWVVEQIYREALAVQLALGDELTAHRVTVTPILCALGGVARGDRAVSGVTIADAKSLARTIRERPSLFGEAEVLALARVADARLRQNLEWEVSD